MNFKKKVSGSWTDTPHYIHNTSTDTITTLPAVIHPTGTTATVGLKGNTLQSSIPSPTSPVMPQGTGDKTGNLWNNLGFSANTISTAGVHSLSNTYGTSLSTVSGGSVDITQVASGGTAAYQNGYFFIEIDISQFSLGDNIVISFDYEITNKLSSTSTTVAYVGQGATGSNVIENWDKNGRAIIKATITSAMTRPYVEIRLCGNSIKVRNVQICFGSTTLPYEPYGYKIPISSANTTTPVYLGEVETTRKIKKLVLTGDETLTSGSVIGQIRTPLTGAINSLGLCTHYIIKTSYSGAFPYFRIANNVLWFELSPDGYETKEEALADFKAYLAQQYAAGTPVTVWYVLATEETAVVNEPLRKIGDYADTVSGITIPTIAGGDTISVDTTLQPSEVTVNYKGWHPVQSVHQKSRNLFDESTIEVGGLDIDTGVEVANNSRRRSGFIKVTPSTAYTLKREIDTSNKSNLWVIGYDANKDVISDGTGTRPTVLTSLGENSAASAFATTPSTEYIRWYVTANGSYSNIMLNEGSTALPYEPYWK